MESIPPVLRRSTQAHPQSKCLTYLLLFCEHRGGIPWFGACAYNTPTKCIFLFIVLRQLYQPFLSARLFQNTRVNVSSCAEEQKHLSRDMAIGRTRQAKTTGRRIISHIDSIHMFGNVADLRHILIHIPHIRVLERVCQTCVFLSIWRFLCRCRFVCVSRICINLAAGFDSNRVRFQTSTHKFKCNHYDGCDVLELTYIS